MLRVSLLGVLLLLAVAWSGCGGECKFDADCGRSGLVCEQGVCRKIEPKKTDGGGFDSVAPPPKDCQDGFTRVCFSGEDAQRDVGICKVGKQTCINGKWGSCDGEVLSEKEVCNSKDDDCDGTVDNGCDCKPGETQPCYSGPAETADKGECKKGTQSCGTEGKWGKCVGEVLPGTETCNQKDDNCDGKVDETCTCKPGETQPCYDGPKGTAGQGPCKEGTQSCQPSGKWSKCTGAVLPGTEDCNGKDDDCDGTIDNGCDCKPGETQACYTGPAGTDGKGICKKGTQACDSGKWGKCVGEVLPGTETCNQKDDNCDGKTDENCQCKPGENQPCYSGPAGTDGKGNCKKGTQSCGTDGKWGTCVGEVLPGTEDCNQKDDDCDGTIDNNLTPPSCSKQAGVCSGAKRRCGSSGWTACTAADYKSNNALYEATETSCDGKDNDCDGQTDTGVTRSCYTGTSGCTKTGSTYKCVGACKAGTQQCVNGIWAACAGEERPKAEGCNQKDDNCDGQIDEGNPQGGQSCMVSGQKGLCAQGEERCINGKISCAQVNQPSTEICNNQIDDDCNGQVDDCGACTNGQTRPCYTARGGCTKSGNTFNCNAPCKAGTQTCTNRQWPTTCVGQVLPKQETCNWVDDDCDGKTDEDAACLYSTWRSSSVPSGTLHVAFVTPSIGLAVGTGGQIRRTTNGSSWSSVTSGVFSTLRHVAVNDRGLVLAVGDGGVILRSVNLGQSFTRVTSGTTNALYGVTISSNGLYAVAVGNAGVVVRSADGGATWQTSSSGTSQNLRAVQFRTNSTTSVAAVGNSGAVITSTNRGSTWASRTSGVTANLVGVAYASSALLATGSSGTVIRSTNSGSTWTKIRFPDTTSLGAILTSGNDSFVTAALNGSTYYVSSDNGATFTKKTYGVSGSFSGIALRSSTALLAYSSSNSAIGEGPARFLHQQRSFTIRSAVFDNGVNSTNCLAVGSSGSLLRSTNGGVTWSPIFLPTSSTFYSVSIESRNAIAVGSGGMIFRSTDRGATWTKVTSPRTNTLYGVAIHGSNAVIVGSSGTLMHSTNAGASWTVRTPPGGSGTLYGVTMKSSLVVAVGSSGRVIRSTNGGSSWTQVGSGLTSSTLYGVIAYDSSSDVNAVGSSGTILHSDNGGSTWTKVTSNSTRTLYGVGMDFLRAVAVGSSGEIVRSTDGGSTWTRTSDSGVATTLYSAFRGYTTSNFIVGGSSSTLLRSTDRGVKWSAVHEPSLTLRVPSVVSSTTMVVPGASGTLSKTTSSGSSWTYASRSSNASMYGVARSPTGVMVAVGTSGDIARSTDDGGTWTKVNAPSTASLYAIANTGSQTFVVAGSNVIYRSTNGGSSFSTVSSPTSNTWRGASCSSSTCLIVGSGGKIIRSSNSGSSFSNISSGTTSTLYGVAMGSVTYAVVVGSSGRVLYSNNGGNTWTAGASPTTRSLYAVAAISSRRFLLADSIGRLFASADNGKTWVQHSPSTTYALFGIGLRSGRGIAVGSGSSRFLYTAP